MLAISTFLHKFRRPVCACFLAAFCAAWSTHAVAAPTADEQKAAVYNAATQAFAKGDWATAVTNLTAVITQAGPNDNLEGTYFFLGASYFNLKDWPNAIATLKKFQTLYPKSQRMPEVLFSIAQASVFNDDYAGAIEYFKQTEVYGIYREQSLYYEGIAYDKSQKPDDAIAAYEKLISPEIRSAYSANGAIELLGLYAKKSDFQKASGIIEQLQKKLDFVDNLQALNSKAVELGDNLVEDEQFKEALLCYRIVRSKDDIVTYQTDKLKNMAQAIDRNLAMIQADPNRAPTLSRENNYLKSAIVQGKGVLDQYTKSTDFRPATLLRIGNCYYKMKKPWEACVVFEELLTKYPDTTQKEYETALFAVTVASFDANRPTKTAEYADSYFKQFPTGPHAGIIGYLKGAAAMQASDYDNAIKYWQEALQKQPDSPKKEDIEKQLGDAYFSSGKFDDASTAYQKYQADYPTGVYAEEVKYRIALCYVFSGKYEDGMNAINDYLTNNPKGAFVTDAKYRLDVCLYAAGQYDQVVKDCHAWEKANPHNPMLGEVLALLADSLDAQDKDDEAVQVYMRAYQLAATSEGMEYAIEAARKILVKQNDWDKVAKMFQDFVKTHPDHPMVPMAIYWIGKAMAHQGKEAEAKQFIAETIQKYIDDPKREAVDQLLLQLTQLCVKKKKAPVVDTPTPAPVVTGTDGKVVAVATPTPTPTPVPAPTPEVDPGAELDALLGKALTDDAPTAKARVLFAKAQLAFMRKQFGEQDKNYDAIVKGFKADDLSPLILALVGDYLLAHNQVDKAKSYYQELHDEYIKSDLLDFAYNGLGQIALQKKDYDKALKFFNDALDKGLAAQKLKDITLGRATALLETEKLDDAYKGFEKIAGNRDWKGELTAESFYYMGLIREKQNNFADANGYYQKVYVTYQRYPQWVAKAYLHSGICFEKVGKNPEAIKTYQEMLRNPKLADLPEADEVKKRLIALGGTTS